MSKPEHVEVMETGGMVCRHCGGKVTAEGYADGGEVEGEAEAMREGDTDDAPQQGMATPGLGQLVAMARKKVVG